MCYGFAYKYASTLRNPRHRATYLMFIGPQSKRYLVHIVLVALDLANFISMFALRRAPFSYYFAILPFLFIIRNDRVLLFGHDFVSAVVNAKHILFSYYCFILIFAVLAISLFRGTVNSDDFADSFESFETALVTGFVFISTTENYEIVCDVFESEYYGTAHKYGGARCD